MYVCYFKEINVFVVVVVIVVVVSTVLLLLSFKVVVALDLTFLKS